MWWANIYFSAPAQAPVRRMRRFRAIATGIGVLTLLAWGLPAAALPRVELPVAVPARLVVGQAATLTVTLRVVSAAGDPAVVAAGVYLQRIGANGAFLGNLGVLRDDGQAGDALAGDGLYSLTVSLNESAPGEVRLRGSVPFTGVARRTLTAPVVIPVEAASAIVLPSLIGRTAAAAQAQLTTLGLTLSEVIQEPNVFVPTGQVIAHDPPAGTELPSGAAVDLRISAEVPPRADEALPPGWAGRWSFSTTYRDLAGVVGTSVSVSEGDICPGDALGLSLAEQVAGAQTAVSNPRCAVSSAGERLTAECTAALDLAVCAASFQSQLQLAKTGDELIGTGSWRIPEACAAQLQSRGQSVSIAGKRVGDSLPGACDPPRSSFLQRFIRNPVTVLMGGAS